MAMGKLFRHRQTKEAETDKPNLKRLKPVLYSTYASSYLGGFSSPFFSLIAACPAARRAIGTR
jgi:hypothetical protein